MVPYPGRAGHMQASQSYAAAGGLTCSGDTRKGREKATAFAEREETGGAVGSA